MVEQAFLVGDGQHLHLLLVLDGGKLDIPFFVSKEMEFHAVAVHHLQDDEQVLYSLAAQCLEFRDDELLDILFNDAQTSFCPFSTARRFDEMFSFLP